MLRSSLSYVHYTFVRIFKIIVQSVSVSPLLCELRGRGFVFSSLYLSAGSYNGLYNIMGLNKYLSDDILSEQSVMKQRKQTDFFNFIEDFTFKVDSPKMSRVLQRGKRERTFQVEDSGK